MRRVTQLFLLRGSRSTAVTGGRERSATHVRRLPRRPELPLRGTARGDARPGARHERDDRAHARDLGERRPHASGERLEPVRPRLPLRRPRRARAQHAGARHGGPDHDLGHAEVGERRQDAELPADADERPDRVLARRRLALLGPLRRLPVRPLLLDLERVEPAALPGAAVRRQGQVGRAAELREARRRSLCRHQGRATRRREGRSRQHVVGRPRQAARRASRPRTRRAASPSSSRPRTRG